MKKTLIILLLLALNTLNAQRPVKPKVRLVEADSDLKERSIYLGEGEDVHFFTLAYEVEGYDDLGRIKEVYETPNKIKYDGRSTRKMGHIVWDKQPYFILRTSYWPNKPYHYVIYKMPKNKKLDDEKDGTAFGYLEMPDKAGSVEHKHRLLTHIEDGNLFITTVFYGSTKRDNFPVHITVTKFDKDLKAIELFNQRVNGTEVSYLEDFALNGKTLCFIKRTFKKGLVFCHIDLESKAYTEHDYKFPADGKVYTASMFLHPSTGEMYEFGNTVNKGVKSLYVKHLVEAGARVQKKNMYSLEALPSYGLQQAVEKQWSSGSKFSDKVKVDLVNALKLDNIYVDDKDNIIIVQEVYVYQSWVNEKGLASADALGFESVITSINPTTLEMNWQTIIPKQQEPADFSEMLSISGVENSDYVGTVSYPYKGGVLVVYNDHMANGRAKLTKTDLEPWTSPKNTNIIGVYVDTNGKATKVVLSRMQGVTLLPKVANQVYWPSRISETTSKPLIFAREKRDTFIGVVK